MVVEGAMVVGTVLEVSVPGTVVTPPLAMVGPVGAGASEVTVELVVLDEPAMVVVEAVEVPAGAVVLDTSDDELVAAKVVVVCALTVWATPPRIVEARTTPSALSRPAVERDFR